MRVENNQDLIAVWIESGFGGSGGSNCSDQSRVPSWRVGVEQMREMQEFSCYPYRFGAEYGNYSNEKITVLGAYDDEVHLEIEGKEYILNKQKPTFYDRLQGISYDTHAYFLIEACYTIKE